MDLFDYTAESVAAPFGLTILLQAWQRVQRLREQTLVTLAKAVLERIEIEQALTKLYPDTTIILDDRTLFVSRDRVNNHTSNN